MLNHSEVDIERAHATVRAIFDCPAEFLDTSNNYGPDLSEARIGDVIRERGGLPADAVISTKLDRDMDPTPRREPDVAIPRGEPEAAELKKMKEEGLVDA